jgi:hypothetical protein
MPDQIFKTPIGKLILVKEMNCVYEIVQGFKDVFVSLYKCCYSFLDPMFAGRLTKADERNIFFKTLFELFSTLFILPLCCQNRQVFVD